MRRHPSVVEMSSIKATTRMVARTTLDLGVYHLSKPLMPNFNEFVWGY